ncbi:hypothetical protein EBU71_15720, partial [bacterium]|nr:hypothetical protein [Candidatus Elulimicrobium humile]
DKLVDNLLGSQGGPYLVTAPGAPVLATPGFIRILQEYKSSRDDKFLSKNVYISDNSKIKTVEKNKDFRQNVGQIGDSFKSTIQENNFFQPSVTVESSDYGPQKDLNGSTEPIADPSSVPVSPPSYVDDSVGSSSGIISDFAKEMVRIASTQVGVTESPPNSNKGSQVEVYQDSTSLGKGSWPTVRSADSWPWCAAFITWLFKTASQKPGISYSFKLPTTAGAWDYENWAKSNSKYVDSFYNQNYSNRPIGSKPITDILPGDIVCFDFSHIGLSVGTLNNGRVDTIEGNTDAAGSREGGGVFKKSRKLDSGGKYGIRSVHRIKYNPDLVRPA